MKKFIKKLTPAFALSFYHWCIAVLSAIVAGFPAKKMIVVGVTGTKGKTSAINFIWSVLTAGGIKTGIISTANIRIGEKEMLNKYHMTMPGRFAIQGLMKEMVEAGCKYCLVETTSEGLKQHRQIGVFYDMGVFMNLTPEHLPSHGGSFEKYKHAKGKMFKALTSHRKKLNGRTIEKVIIANRDSEHADYYLSFRADRKITFGLKSGDFRAENVQMENTGAKFSVNSVKYELSIPGNFNIYNALPAVIIGELAGVSREKIGAGLKRLHTIPGRMERIDEGQDFTVFVDYAHEKESITGVLETANAMKGKGSKVIILLGAEGGGRDKAKRPVMGELAARMADYVIVSNVDPYEDDPTEIAEDIAVVSEKFGKVRGKDLFVIEDRTGGIKKALSLATKGDIVLITGKGAEQSIVIGGKSTPWDDREIVRQALKLVC